MYNLITKLNALGLSHSQAQDIGASVGEYLKKYSPEEAWQLIIKHILNQSQYKSLPFVVHKLLYETVYPNCDFQPGIAWLPTKEIVKKANISLLMQELGIFDYQKLHDWSVKNYPDFWHRMIRALNIIFDKDYQDIVDLTAGVASPRWLPGAMLNIAKSCFNANPSDAAIIFQTEEGRLTQKTYQELDRLSNHVASSLLRHLQVGDRVALIMPMTPEAVAIYLGIIKAGCCVVSIADSFASAEIAARLKIANAKAVFTQDYILREGKKLPLYEKIKNAHAPFTIVLPAGLEISSQLNSGDLRWEDFLIADENFQTVTCKPQAYTNILFSSGTTGEPKAIPWDHVTPIKCGSDAYLYQNIQPGDIICWPTSLGWMMGSWLIYAAFLNKATIALYDGAPSGKIFGKFIQDAKVNVLGLVPSHVRNWHLSNCMEGFDWRSIKLFSSSGECSNVDDMLYLMFLANYRPVIEYCGGTEIGGAYLTSTVMHSSAPSTFSALALGMDILILDQNDTPVESGEIALIPPSIGLSVELLNKDHHQIYYADMPLSPDGRTLRRHGDQVQRFANQFYRMHGRIDDTMNLGGIKISSVEIECVLNRLLFLSETAAIPITPQRGGPSLLVIYAVLKNKETISLDHVKIAMQKAIKEHLNPLFKIHDVVLVNTLPRTASNKLMRRVLKDQYQERMQGVINKG